MLREAGEAPQVVERQLACAAHDYARLGELLRRRPPPLVLSLARGSSAHAACYMNYLLGLRCGLPAYGLPMSLLSLQGAQLQVQGALAVAISQSGQSPDLRLSLQQCATAGATTVALVNELESPLAAAASWPISLHAGPELCVAATKSCLASFVAGALLLAHWQQDLALLAAMARLPDLLHQLLRSDCKPALDLLAPAQRLMVVGRGLGYGVAREAALKLKETCALQAEAFSAAEIRHGPMTLLGAECPLLVIATEGPTMAGLLDLAQELRARGAPVLLLAPERVPGHDIALPDLPMGEWLQPLLALQLVYRLAAGLARRRGLDPDRPPHLSKVTRTH